MPSLVVTHFMYYTDRSTQQDNLLSSNTRHLRVNNYDDNGYGTEPMSGGLVAFIAILIILVVVASVIELAHSARTTAVVPPHRTTRQQRSTATRRQRTAARPAIPTSPVLRPTSTMEVDTELALALEISLQARREHLESELQFAHVVVVEEDETTKNIELSYRAANPKEDIRITSADGKDCAICLQAYQKDDIVSWSRNPQCHHAFHKKCALDWLVTQTVCPVCRQQYVGLPNT